MAVPSRCSIITRIVFASIGVFVGVSIFLTFGSHYKNYDAAAWGLVSGLGALMALVMHVSYKRNGLIGKETLLNVYSFVGGLLGIAGLAAFIAYLVTAIIEKQSVTPNGPDGYYVASVWAAMTCKWGFLLLYYARSYTRLVAQDDQGLLLPQV